LGSKAQAVAINSLGRKTFQPEEVKDIYLREGTAHLRRKLEMPESDEKEIIASEPPREEKRSSSPPPPKNWNRPRWWSSMYNRDAKSIGSQVWLDLMKPATWQEVLNIILSGETNKAAGIDGVNCDLIRLLVEDSETENEPTPLLKIIVSLINESLERGCTPRSWRKAIISMVPKRKEDGSYTFTVSQGIVRISC